MQASQDTLSKFVSQGFDTQEFEELKDRFLAWQSAALIFAIQQADFEKLAEIQKTYESLGRKDEFISIFRRVSINRLREFSSDGPSIQAIIDALYKELEFAFNHHHKVLRRFLDDDAASTVLSEAIQEGLTRVESLKTAIVELLHLLSDIFVHSEALFSHDVKKVVQQPIDKCLDNFLARLKSWEYGVDSQRRPRSLEDAIAVCSASGQLVFGLQEFKTMVSNVERKNFVLIKAHTSNLNLPTYFVAATLSPNIKSALKWNRGVCDFVMKSAIDRVVPKMTSKMEEIKTKASKDSRVANLPAFSTSPHEYITTTGQELLQLFHRWEQFFLDDNVVHSFYIALKKKFEGDELFKKTVADVANSVIASFVSSVGDPSSFSKDLAKQFYADTAVTFELGISFT
ncbi:hypothetical protein TELCIR_05984 [Teladorsagia circumcincta]|uniref:Conserved oligomeric Golgi complex subunit 7 n=1 Tax=Teladorsagia circumcincta TaxID=45464 RepID=A0A2G9UPD0_TELCI|nr:hypothetical protein TELCIR_05984 [Teladorsagia circumcincta]